MVAVILMPFEDELDVKSRCRKLRNSWVLPRSDGLSFQEPVETEKSEAARWRDEGSLFSFNLSI